MMKKVVIKLAGYAPIPVDLDNPEDCDIFDSMSGDAAAEILHAALSGDPDENGWIHSEHPEPFAIRELSTYTLREFWASRKTPVSVFADGFAEPTGRTWLHDTISDGDDYCDLWEVIDSGLSLRDPWGLTGTIEGDTWTWDGAGDFRDHLGNSWIRFEVRAEATQ